MIMKNTNKRYYNFKDDLQKYPDAWLYVVYSRRGAGKTYSALLSAYDDGIPIVYMKRTNDDVEFICRSPEDDFDTSPYVPLNRDHDISVYGKIIDNGVGGFWHYEDGAPEGLPVAYALSLNAIKRIKGFDASRCDWIICDEFIPQIGERVNKKEGELLLDVYMTISRDRQKRGKKPLKLILFANAEDISTPITNTLEIVDIIADLNARNESYYYNDDTGIMIHHITEKEFPLEEKEKTGIYKAMANTAWGQKSFSAEFSSNDFSNVKPQSLKGFHGFIRVRYKAHEWFIYTDNSGNYYMCRSQTKTMYSYDLNRENDQKLFYYEHFIDLWEELMNDRFKFQTYSMYDLMKNYTKYFDVRR